MKKHIAFILVLLAGAAFLLSGNAHAFNCTGTKVYNVNSFTVTRQAGVEVPPLPTAQLNCAGASGEQDALRIQSVTLNQKLIDAGFVDSTLEVSSSGTFQYPFTSALNTCVWYDNKCTVVNATGLTSALTPTLKRTGPGKDVTMNNGETLLTIVLYQRSNGVWGWPLTISYKLSGNITPPVYTCSVSDYDASVQMPKLDAIFKFGPQGKIISSKKEFNLKLNCQPETILSLQLDGTKMTGTGTNDVLKNITSGNDNVGVQLFNNDTPIKLGTKFEITNNTSAVQDIKLMAYYFYKGGGAQAGMLKSSATFTFTYQ